MTDYDAPPFDASDQDRLEIWRMLVERDTDAFLRGDWNAIADDFAATEFFGLDARHRADPREWQFNFPSLAAYRAEWLRQAAESARTADPARARAAAFAATSLRDIEIRGDVALARKQFDGALPHRDGGSTRLHWQTLYVCRRLEGRWKIASFVGYLPFDAPSGGKAIFAAAARQHRAAGPYTPVMGVSLDGHARMFVISGQAPLDMEGRVVGTTIAEQSRATLENCRHQLEAAGCSLSDVFKATVFLTDLANWDAFNQVYREFFRPPYPARTAIQAGLLPGFLVEVEMWAARR